MSKGKRKAAKRTNPKRKRSHAKRANPKKRKAAAKRTNPRRKRHHAKRANPRRRTTHHAKRKNPRRRHYKKKNPGVPEALMRAGKAVLGGVAAAGAVVGTVKLQQKYPAKTKAVAVGTDVAAAVVGGAALSLLSPAAGAIYSAGMLVTAAQTAMAPSASAGAPQLNGVMGPRALNGVMARPDGRDDLTRAATGPRMVQGVISNLRAAR